MTIRTRWHKIYDAVEMNNVRIMAGSGPVLDPFKSDRRVFDSHIFASMINYMSSIPRFVVDRSVIDIIKSDQALMSISDMQMCNVLHLPFQSCVVEFEYGEYFCSVLLREIDKVEGRSFWLCSNIRLVRVGKTEVVLASPCMVQVRVQQNTDELNDTSVSFPPQPVFKYDIFSEQFVIDDDSARSIIQDASEESFQLSFIAYLAAMLLPRTVGLKRENVSVKPSFNRERQSKGRSTIPDHTVISLGTYQTASGTTSDVESRSGVEIHLRRAHKRRVALGEGRSKREWRFIPAQVVGYLPDGRKPTLPEMLATRATKPYHLK